jgi:hypothetical protein
MPRISGLRITPAPRRTTAPRSRRGRRQSDRVEDPEGGGAVGGQGARLVDPGGDVEVEPDGGEHRRRLVRAAHRGEAGAALPAARDGEGPVAVLEGDAEVDAAGGSTVKAPRETGWTVEAPRGTAGVTTATHPLRRWRPDRRPGTAVVGCSRIGHRRHCRRPTPPVHRRSARRKEVRAVQVTTDVRAGIYPFGDPNG